MKRAAKWRPGWAAFLFAASILLASGRAPGRGKPSSIRPGQRSYATQTRAVAASTQRTPVVVELFSSEGCSSCPPADAFLKQLETRQAIPGVEVIALEEHVDYWNHDGWVDPFSSEIWTDRQQDYVYKLKVGTEFTPETIVDGRGQTSGNDVAGTVALIAKAAQEPQTEVSVAAGNPDGKNAQEFAVSVGKLADATPGKTEEIWLAVTEDGLHSSVSAGENAGHELYHAAVLRSLTKIGDANAAAATNSFSGDPRVKFNSHWERQNLRVVVFVQEKQTKRILGAAETRLSQASRD
jgi:hypothetical protein